MVRTEISDNGDRDVIGIVGEGMRTAALSWFRIGDCNGEVCAGGVAGCDPEWRCCCCCCCGEQAESPGVWMDCVMALKMYQSQHYQHRN